MADHDPTGHLLRGLNEAQRAAVTSESSPLRILAGAGSGKTRVLTHRIAHEAAVGRGDPARVLAVTFTRKAAGELRERLGRLGLRSGVQAGTFHAIAYAQLRQRWEERGIRPPELLERKVGFVARLSPSRDRTLPLDLVSEIEWASARLVTPDTYVAAAGRAHRRPPVDPSVVADVYARYVEAKRKRRLVDFDDLLRLATRDLDADPVYATARRWRFRHLYVDEFQDVNPLQHRLLAAWLGPESTVCVVGDPNQAIYAWNGADARYLVDFDRFFPGGDTIALEDNYRSTPEILGAANAVLATGHGATFMRLRPHRSSGPSPTVRAFADETAEAHGVARSCRDRHRPGEPWRAQAVLVRTNAQAAVLAEAFTRAGIPHRVRGSGSLLEQPEIRQALGALRRAGSVRDFLSDCEREARLDALALDGPDPDGPGTERGLDDTGSDGAEPPAEGMAAATGESGDHGRPGAPGPRRDDGGPSAADQPGGPSAADDRRANVAELVRLGREYLALDPEGTPGAFAAWLGSTLRNEDAGGDAVEIVTFHAAKGLEWPIVHIAGLEKGFVPIHHAEDDAEAVDEERRLLYVALTRAREELHCTWAERRAFGSRSLRRSPSPWLEAVGSVRGPGGRLPAAETARRAAAAKAKLPSRDGPAAADRPLFEALRAWRREQALKGGVPAYVVFNDATLRAVAEQRPATVAELLDVPGIGPAKAERFGADVLRIVAEAASSARR
jgi:DNA helicase-2/ATP-dependent DNA helicase PcrA